MLPTYLLTYYYLVTTSLPRILALSSLPDKSKMFLLKAKEIMKCNTKLLSLIVVTNINQFLASWIKWSIYQLKFSKCSQQRQNYSFHPSGIYLVIFCHKMRSLIRLSFVSVSIRIWISLPVFTLNLLGVCEGLWEFISSFSSCVRYQLFTLSVSPPV